MPEPKQASALTHSRARAPQVSQSIPVFCVKVSELVGETSLGRLMLCETDRQPREGGEDEIG